MRVSVRVRVCQSRSMPVTMGVNHVGAREQFPVAQKNGRLTLSRDFSLVK